MQFHHAILTVSQFGYLPGGRITLHRGTQATNREAKCTQAKKEQFAQHAVLAIEELEEQQLRTLLA